MFTCLATRPLCQGLSSCSTSSGTSLAPDGFRMGSDLELSGGGSVGSSRATTLNPWQLSQAFIGTSLCTWNLKCQIEPFRLKKLWKFSPSKNCCLYNCPNRGKDPKAALRNFPCHNFTKIGSSKALTGTSRGMSAVGPSVNTKSDGMPTMPMLWIPWPSWQLRLAAWWFQHVSTPFPPEVLATRLLLMQGRSSCTQHKGEKTWKGPR